MQTLEVQDKWGPGNTARVRVEVEQFDNGAGGLELRVVNPNGGDPLAVVYFDLYERKLQLIIHTEGNHPDGDADAYVTLIEDINAPAPVDMGEPDWEQGPDGNYPGRINLGENVPERDLRCYMCGSRWCVECQEYRCESRCDH